MTFVLSANILIIISDVNVNMDIDFSGPKVCLVCLYQRVMEIFLCE